MRINTSTSNENFIGVDVFKLEFLKSICCKIRNISSQALQRKTKSLEAISCFKNKFAEMFTSFQELVKFVCIFIFAYSNLSSNGGSWLQSAICYHIENIYCVMGKAMGLEISAFLVIIHFKGTT
jgi:flagellar biosynthesis protein FlhB